MKTVYVPKKKWKDMSGAELRSEEDRLSKKMKDFHVAETILVDVKNFLNRFSDDKNLSGFLVTNLRQLLRGRR